MTTEADTPRGLRRSDLRDFFARHLPAERPAGLVAAFSGGPDSSALVHALAAARDLLPPLELLHVDHGLDPASAGWAEHCRRAAAELALPCTVARVAAQPVPGESPEAAARAARYRAFAEHLAPGACLVLAHHRRDQAETLLLQLMRGAGPRGLAAMAPWMAFGPGFLARPLLDVPGGLLRQYAAAAGLAVIHDPANEDAAFARARVRSELWPILTAIAPGAEAALARSARLAAEAADILDTAAAVDLEACGAGGGALALAPLQALAPARRRNLVRYWLEFRGLPVPHEAHVDQVLGMGGAAPDRAPRVQWPGGEVRRFRKALHAMAPLPPVPADFDTAWDLDGALRLPAGAGELRREGGSAVEPVRVRFRRGGEALRVAAGGHTRDLKHLCQEAGIPPWVRARMPMLWRGDELVAAGPWRTPAFSAELDQAGCRLRWTPAAFAV